MKSYRDVAVKYATDVVNGSLIAGTKRIQACQRFLDDLKRDDIELRTKEPDFVINIIQMTIVHQKGEDLDGNPLTGTPFILLPWQIFIVYNLVGWYFTGTSERRYKEAFIFVPRKNGKTSFIAGLAWALSLLGHKSGSTTYIVSASQKQALQSFEFLKYNTLRRDDADQFRVLDNNAEHSIYYDFG